LDDIEAQDDSMMETALSRRTVISGASLAALALVMAPHLARADARAVELELKKLFGDAPMAAGRVKLELPQIAENGLVVPLNIEVDSPMTETDYVKAVHVFAEGNPLPHVISYRFTPASGRAAASNRIRLAQTQTLIAVAEMSDGGLYMAKAEVKVTIGGCGG
jgi:sulfur-oxidizing protein SoxY